MRTRTIATDYSIGATHGYLAAELAEAIGDFGISIWQAADRLLNKIESRDRFDGQRFADCVFYELVRLIPHLGEEWEDDEDCDKKLWSRVHDEAAS
jgi:hypothetical protein